MNVSDLRKDKYRELFFAVVGRGAFPTDMLRYDGCFPAQEVDSYAMQFTYCFHEDTNNLEPRVVWLRRLVRDGSKVMPTSDRWSSLGWYVVEPSLQSWTPNDIDRQKITDKLKSGTPHYALGIPCLHTPACRREARVS